MNKLKIIYLMIGIGLLAYILNNVEIDQVWVYMSILGWSILFVLAVYFLAFFVDSLSWQLMLDKFGFNLKDTYALWKIRMIGEAFNSATPFGSLGGEPVKAFLLNKNHLIGYNDAIASLILAKTTNLIALVVFLSMGSFLVLKSDLPATYTISALTGLIFFSIAIALFFLVQRYKITSITGNFFIRGEFKERLELYLGYIHLMEEKLIYFYTQKTWKFILALTLALINWLLGVLELYVIMYLSGTPVTFEMAYIIEAAVQLIRAVLFFIPSALGAQEGIFVILTTAMTGNASLGLAVAFVRRIREILWIIWGILLGWQFTGKGKLIAVSKEVGN